MFNQFKICGNRPHIRTDEEMLAVNKAVADEAFKKHKEVLDEYLISGGVFEI